MATRGFYRQRLQAELTRPERPWCLTVAGGCFAAYAGAPGQPAVTAVTVPVPAALTRTTVKTVIAPSADEQTIRPDAKLLFVAGAGWTKKQSDGATHAPEAGDIILGFLGKSKASLGSSKSLVDMKRGPWRIFILLLVLLLAGSGPALARRSGSSFSSGGRSSSSTRSSGWGSSSSAPKSSGWGSSRSAPSTPSSGWGSTSQPSTRSVTPDRGGWSNSSGRAAPSGGETARPRSSFATSGRAAIQKESSRKAYTEYQGRFAKPDNPVGPSAGQTTPIPAPSRTWDNYRDYRSYRDTYYAGRGWSAPGYAYRSYPSFGLWDAMEAKKSAGWNKIRRKVKNSAGKKP